jgi:hypothetical protein
METEVEARNFVGEQVSQNDKPCGQAFIPPPQPNKRLLAGYLLIIVVRSKLSPTK